MSICRCYQVDKEIPSLSVRICLSFQLTPICRIMSCHLPLKMILLIDYQVSDCQLHFIPFLLSYIFNNLAHNLSNIPDSLHSWNLLWHVEPEPYSLGNIFHWHPVLKTNMIPSNTFL
jgi:hypothetical protein